MNKCNIQDGCLTNLLVKIGATISGVKPAELINIKNDEILNKCKKCISKNSYLGYLEIKKLKGNKVQMLFYHKQALFKTLNNKLILNFLKQLGYPENFSLEDYLQILKAKLQSNNFPHEIGLFLGYPVKDVLGYMGKYPLKLVTIKGWRYYGSKKVSAIQYEKFLKARKNIKNFMSNLNSPEEIFNYIN